jgi:hypothetical protein
MLDTFGIALNEEEAKALISVVDNNSSGTLGID